MSNTPEDYEALVRDQLTQLGYDASAIPDDVLRQFLRDFDDKIGLDEPDDDGMSALGYPTALEEGESLGAASVGQWRTTAAVSYTAASDLPAGDACLPCTAAAFDAARFSGLDMGSDDGRGGAAYGMTRAAAAAALAGGSSVAAGMELSGWGDEEEDLLSTTMRRPTGPTRGPGRPASLVPAGPEYSCARRATETPASRPAPVPSSAISGRVDKAAGAHRPALGEAAPSSANFRGGRAARRDGGLPAGPTSCGGANCAARARDPVQPEADREAVHRPARADARPATAPPAPPGGWSASRPVPRCALGPASGIPTPRSAAFEHGAHAGSTLAVIRRVDGTPRRSKQDPVSNYHRHVSGWKGNGFLSLQSPHARSSTCAASPAPPTREAPRRRPPSDFVVPTSKRRDDVVWETRIRMKAMRDGLHAASNGGPLAPRRSRSHAPNTFVVPTDKRRDSLRWKVRADMAYAH